MRDGEERYGGKGVRGAVAALRDEIGPLLVGRDAGGQERSTERWSPSTAPPI